MKTAIYFVVAFLIFLGSVWVYQNTDAPFYCHGWMKYDRSCSGWTFFGEDK